MKRVGDKAMTNTERARARRARLKEEAAASSGASKRDKPAAVSEVVEKIDKAASPKVRREIAGAVKTGSGAAAAVVPKRLEGAVARRGGSGDSTKYVCENGKELPLPAGWPAPPAGEQWHMTGYGKNDPVKNAAFVSRMGMFGGKSQRSP
jgi:hypothetical protein